MKIGNLILAGAAALLAGAGSAIAADIPVKAAPVSSYTWTGWYAGLNAGYGWSDTRSSFAGDGSASTIVLNTAFDTLPHTQALNPSGFVGGGQVGYNWQFGKNWIAGFEADLQYSDVKADSFFDLANGGVNYGVSSRQGLEWFGTVRGRLGFLLTERLAVYGTGGLAYGGTKSSASIDNTSILTHIINVGPTTVLTCPAFATCIAGTESRVSAGWTAGSGIEYAPWNNVTFKVEYLHIDLGDQTVLLTARAPATGDGYATAKFDNAYDIVRAGVNWKF